MTYDEPYSTTNQSKGALQWCSFIVALFRYAKEIRGSVSEGVPGTKRTSKRRGGKISVLPPISHLLLRHGRTICL